MKLLKYIRTGLTSGVILIHTWFWYFLRYSKHPEKYDIGHRYEITRKAAVGILHHFRSDIQYEGYENLVKALEDKEHGTLIVGNHNSAFNILDLMIFTRNRPVVFTAKKELKKAPFLGKSVMSIDGLFLDRDDPRQAIEILHKSVDVLKNGGIIAIYPEGTRNKDPLNTGISPLHPGSFKSAVRAGANIVVVSDFGPFRYLEPNTNYRSNLIQISFSLFIPAEEVKKKSTQELAEICFDVLQKDNDRMKERDKQYIAEGKHKHFSKNKWWKTPLLKK